MKKVKVNFVDGREEYFDTDYTTNCSSSMFWYSAEEEMFYIKKSAMNVILLPREFVRYICVAD